ncbi:MAG TPA: ShlB/FhaC/HecB family hemolysin secretion/activation protein [Firmicutes bacterium]|nr:ShlB/FhaC/HecB family hemolysin secretion/activation protein [Bacillota bacterium]
MARRADTWLIKLLWLAVLCFCGLSLPAGVDLPGRLSLGGGRCLAAEMKIYVSAIITDDSEILTTEEIAAITGLYIGREVTVAQLNEVVAQINRLYEQKGFITARAVLPAQTVKEGVVHIRLVEGRVGKVEVTGNRTAVASFYTRRIRIKPGELVRLERIAKEVGYFNRLHSDQVQVQLKAGQEFGTTDFLLLVNPAPDQRSIFIDNGGRKDTGIYRIGATYVRQHLFRRGDPLSLSLMWAEGMLAGSLAYQIPIGTRGARLRAGYDTSDIKVLSPEFADLEIKGHSYDAYLEFSYPWLVTSSLLATSPVQWHRKYSRSTFSGASLAGTEERTGSVGINLQWQKPGFAGMSQCSYLVGDTRIAGDEEAEVEPFRKVYCSLSGQAAVAGRLVLKLKGTVQSSKDPLPTTEKLSVGGMETVRGYAEGELSRDRGYFVGLELEVPLGRSATMSVFADHGGAFLAGGTAAGGGGAAGAGAAGEGAESTNHLTGYGVGLNWRLLSGLNLKVTYALAPKRQPVLHASLQLAF